MASLHVRKPRFTRAPTRGLILTPRDFEILRAVRRYRFLRSTHVAAILGASRQAVVRRLGLLFHHGYLDRPPQQLDWYAKGSEPMVYALGNRGAKELMRLDGVQPDGVRWDTKNGRAGRGFLRHALAVAEVMAAFEAACRTESPATLIRQEEILAGLPAERRALRLPLRWTVDLRYSERTIRLGIEPDQVFGLRLATGLPNRREVFFLLEADRGTMPVRRRGLGRSSFFRKLLAYDATWRQGLHRARLGLPNFRVLTVTSGEERSRHLIGAARELRAPAGLLLFSERVALTDRRILTHGWRDSRGEEVRLTPSTASRIGELHL